MLRGRASSGPSRRILWLQSEARPPPFDGPRPTDARRSSPWGRRSGRGRAAIPRSRRDWCSRPWSGSRASALKSAAHAGTTDKARPTTMSGCVRFMALVSRAIGRAVLHAMPTIPQRRREPVDMQSKAFRFTALRVDVLRYAASASSDRCIAAIPASIAFDRKPPASSGRKSTVQTTEVKPSASSETWSAAL